MGVGCAGSSLLDVDRRGSDDSKIEPSLQGPYPPTDQDKQVFVELSKELDNVLARLKELEGQVAAQ